MLALIRFIFMVVATIVSFNIYCHAQMWTWMHGSPEPHSVGVRGPLGVSDSANAPGAREDPCAWTGRDGSFYLFGGQGKSWNYYGDLWKYTPETHMWAWISGPAGTEQPAHYGTRGVAAPDNVPPGRASAVTWTDHEGRLWMFGGRKTGGHLNDLWMFDPGSLQWTWVHGSDQQGSAGSYGTLRVPDDTNTPSARIDAVGWMDAAGDLWLFGGYGTIDGWTRYFSDVWKFDVSAGQWTWMQGSRDDYLKPVFGTQGLPNPANTPGGRYEAVGWTDAEGNFWLFGGKNKVVLEFRNDMWKFDPRTLEWTWMHGPQQGGQRANYGRKGIPEPANIPGARNSACGWVDGNGFLWLFGGQQYKDPAEFPIYNDLWYYNPYENMWTWISGSQLPYQYGVFGDLGVPSENNVPGARMQAVAWVRDGFEFWLFGGSGYGIKDATTGWLNALWRYASSINPVETVPARLSQLVLALDGASPVIDRARFRYVVPVGQRYTLEIRNLLGKRVALLDEGEADGLQRWSDWVPNAVPPGVYLCCLTTDAERLTRRLLVMD